MAKVRLLDPNDSKRRLDRYELIGELASGGMATVFLGRLGGVGGFQRFVAIKRLHPHLANEQEFIEMFLDEARLAAGIHHPHVVPILEVGESESGYYLVMEYIEGDTLARLMARALARAQPIPRPVLVRIILDSLAGLHAAHELLDPDGQPVQLVHRDVSPQNVLVGVDGSSRITDFGVAHAASRLQNTRADRLKGKLAYMSPEQARAGDIDRRADIFAMGIILWEVLAAKRLFKGETEAVTLHRVTAEPIPRLASVVQGVHPSLDQVCARALERDPTRRFRTAADFAEALERAARAAASSSATDLGVASPREVAAYVQGALGEDIAAQRESVRAWLAHSEPSLPKLGAKQIDHGKPPGYDVTVRMPLDRDASSGVGGREGSRPNAREGSRPNIMVAPVAIPTPLAAAALASADPRAVVVGSTPLPASAPAALARARGGGSAPSVREALGIPATAPLYDGGRPPIPPAGGPTTADGASASEAPVEPVDDDDEHETLLMDREAAALELARRKVVKTSPAAAPAAATPTPAPAAASSAAAAAPVPPAPTSAPFSEDGTASKSIESFMVPAAPPPSRTPQIVALVVALLLGLGGLVVWWQVRAETPAPQPASGPGSTTQVVTVAATTTPPPSAAPTPSATVEAIPVSALPPATPSEAQHGRPKGHLPKGKPGAPTGPADPPAPATAATPPPTPPPPPDLPKPEDLANPYR